MEIKAITFPVQINENQKIVQRDFLGLPQYYLYQGQKMIRIVDVEEVEEVLKFL